MIPRLGHNIRTVCTLILVVFVILVSTQSVLAFDGKREGFFMSLGNGPGIFNAQYNHYTLESDDFKESGSTVSFDFEIGAGVGEQWQYFWAVRNNFALEKRTSEIGSAGIGIRYFVLPKTPSWFLSAVFGFNRFGYNRSGYGNGSGVGPGFCISVGQEFLKNWRLQVGGLINGLDDIGSYGVDFGVCSVIISHAWQ